MQQASLGALRLNSDRSERQRGGDRRIGGRRDGDADHSGLAASQISIASFSMAFNSDDLVMLTPQVSHVGERCFFARHCTRRAFSAMNRVSRDHKPIRHVTTPFASRVLSQNLAGQSRRSRRSLKTPTCAPGLLFVQLPNSYFQWSLGSTRGKRGCRRLIGRYEPATRPSAVGRWRGKPRSHSRLQRPPLRAFQGRRLMS